MFEFAMEWGAALDMTVPNTVAGRKGEVGSSAASLLQVQVANFCSGRAGVFIDETTNLTTDSSVIEGQEPHIRPRFMFHD